MRMKTKHFILIVLTITSITFAKISLADECDDYATLAEYGVLGEDSFSSGNNSTINGSTISGSGNTPTPTGTMQTVDETFPELDPATFPATGGSDISKKNEAASVAAGSYGKITFEAGNTNDTIIFTGGNYYINELELKGNKATAQLAPGDYFIEKLSMDNQTNIILMVNHPMLMVLALILPPSTDQ